MTCPKCGAPLAPGLRFCKQCWSPVDAAAAAPPSTPAPTRAPSQHRDHGGPLFGVGYNEPDDAASGPLHATNIPQALVAPKWTPQPANADAGKPSSRAIAAMMFGLISVVFFCGFIFTVPFDLIGLALAFFELRAIARGEKPLAGKNLSTIGLVICSIVLAIKAFLMLAVFS